MITFASVDLPEPFGPIRRMDLAPIDCQLDAAQYLLVLRLGVQIVDLQVGHASFRS